MTDTKRKFFAAGFVYALPVGIVLWAITGGAVWLIWSN